MLTDHLVYRKENSWKKFFKNFFSMRQIPTMKYLIINLNQRFFSLMTHNISIKNLGNTFIFSVEVLFRLQVTLRPFLSLVGSAPTSLLIMAMRDPPLNEDELHTRMNTLRDSPTTKHVQLMGTKK